MRRGWVDGWSKFFPAKEQRDALEESKVKPIYEAGKDGTLAEFLRACRRGDVIVVYGMNSLAQKVDVYDATIADIARRGLEIEDMLTKTIFSADGILAYATGRSRILTANRTKSKKEAARRGAMGGKPPNILQKMTKEQAKRIWKDLSIRTNAEAAEMIGQNEQWCRRNLDGPSGRPKGFDKARR